MSGDQGGDGNPSPAFQPETSLRLPLNLSNENMLFGTVRQSRVTGQQRRTYGAF